MKDKPEDVAKPISDVDRMRSMLSVLAEVFIDPAIEKSFRSRDAHSPVARDATNRRVAGVAPATDNEELVQVSPKP